MTRLKFFSIVVIFAFIMLPLNTLLAQEEHDHDHDHEVVKDSTAQPVDTVKSLTEDEVQPKKSDEPAKEVTVLSGTTFKIIINSLLSTDRSFVGSTFSASLADDLVVDTMVVSTKSSLVVGKIVASKKAQGLEYAELSIQITEITINDKLVPVDTNPITVKGKRKRNAEAEIPAGTIEEVQLKSPLVIK